MLDQITPVILTYNEAPNIERALAQLCWARDIVVVDSFSDDNTLESVSRLPRVRVFQRSFDNHGQQWDFALNETGISTEWVLGLDADFVLTSALLDEIGSLQPSASTAGFQARFTYCIHGRPLRSGLLRAQTVLYRKSRAQYASDGHAQRLLLDGEVQRLRTAILHDDRKSLRRWFESQQQYMRLEAQKILASETSSLGTADRIRRWRVIAPAAVLLYCLIVRAGVLDGWPGFYYAFQRALAELVLSLYLLESDLANANPAERSFASADPDCTDARKTEPAPGVPQIELASPKSEVRNS